MEPFSDPVTKPIHKVLKHLKETIYEGKHYDFRHLRDPKIESERGKSRAGKKKGGKVDKKGWANGGTVTMPTVGQDTFMRTYKHGAIISPRPRPTVPHGRMRGTGIAKRGW